METDLIDIKDKQTLGKKYFIKGLNFARKREFGKAFECFKDSLDLITCDCEFYKWNKSNSTVINELFNDQTCNSIPSEYFFVKAFLLSYLVDDLYLQTALITINDYNNEDEYSYYIKYRILYRLKNIAESAKCIALALTLNPQSPRLNFMYGKLIEDKFEGSGSLYIFTSFWKNFSSKCSLTQVRNLYFKHNLKFESIEGFQQNEILQRFLSEDSANSFSDYYQNRFSLQLVNRSVTEEINEFYSFLCSNSRIFINLNPNSIENLKMKICDKNQSLNPCGN